METTQVRILEKFGVSSVILPYFGYAHQSFLLLSRLSQRSRAMLDDFYREIINWLFEWNIMISINEYNIKMLYLPSDLFKYSFNLKDGIIFREFIEFLKMKDHHKGYYFKAHYMHERLWIWNLYIQPDLVQKLVPHFDILKSIKVIDNNDCVNLNSESNSYSIIDMFVLQDSDFIVDDTHFVLPQYLIEASKLAESESIWKPFYKIFYICLSYKSYSEAMSILEDIGNLRIKIDALFLSASNIEELENLTFLL